MPNRTAAIPESSSDGRTIGLDEQYLICALVYAVAGMALGIYMAASQNHGQFITHAHALLVGFVVSLLYAAIHKLWLPNGASRLASAQFLAHQVGAAGVVIGLFELFGGSAPRSVIEPVLTVGSSTVLGAAVLMLVMVVRSRTAPRLPR